MLSKKLQKNADFKKSKAFETQILSLLRGDYVKNNYSKREIARLRYALNEENKKRMSMTYYEHNFNNVLIECVQIMHYPHQTMRPKNITMKKQWNSLLITLISLKNK